MAEDLIFEDFNNTMQIIHGRDNGNNCLTPSTVSENGLDVAEATTTKPDKNRSIVRIKNYKSQRFTKD